MSLCEQLRQRALVQRLLIYFWVFKHPFFLLLFVWNGNIWDFIEISIVCDVFEKVQYLLLLENILFRSEFILRTQNWTECFHQSILFLQKPKALLGDLVQFVTLYLLLLNSYISVTLGAVKIYSCFKLLVYSS